MTDANMSSGVTSDDKLWAALGYVFSPLVPIIIMLMEDKKSRPFIRAHNVQALIMGIVIWVIAGATLGCGSLLWFVMLFWAYKAYQGEMVQIPVITDLVKNQGWG
ncbi:MAG: hypothetical protein EPO32_03595 [Anaerolineae bacterium]|nr:MAG: hypothetical protein EPO32_03595 [Anaerolineae bacterium]